MSGNTEPVLDLFVVGGVINATGITVSVRLIPWPGRVCYE